MAKEKETTEIIMVFAEVPKGKYCYTDCYTDSIHCPYLDKEGGLILCHLGFYPKKQVGFILRPKECKRLKLDGFHYNGIFHLNITKEKLKNKRKMK